MRGFISLLFAAALAAHLGPAGAPSLGGAPVCADGVGANGQAAENVLYPASALCAAQSEAAPDIRERTGRPEPRRTVAAAAAARARRARTGPSRGGEAATAGWLLALLGHPTTAPPLQA